MEESDAYSLFIYAINSPATRVKYEGRLRKFFDFTGIQETSLKEYCNIFYRRAKDDEVTGVTCNTIHKMLGAENDIVVLATTRCNDSRDLGFMTQPELLNYQFQ